MRLSVPLICSALSGQAALACTPAEITRDQVTRDQQCQTSYAWRDRMPVYSNPAEDLGNGIVKQVISTGVCDQGEAIVVYFDCKTGQGTWLGGTKDNVPELQPGPSHPGDTAPIVLNEGVAGGFIRTEESRFAPAYDIQVIYARASRLGWVSDKGRLSQSRMSVDGGTFDMQCGCDLFYRNH